MSRKVKGLFGFSYYRFLCESNHTDLDIIKDMIENGKIKPCSNHIFPLDQASEAFELSHSGKAVGKIVVQLRKEEINLNN